MTTEFSFVALKDEIVADTEALGYKNSATADDWKGDQVIADLVNAKNFTLTHDELRSAEIKGVIPQGEFQGLAAAEESWLVWITGTEMLAITPTIIDALFDDNGTTGLNSIWSNQQTSGASIRALAEFQGGRGEVLWGHTVTAGDVGRAFNELP